MKSFDQGSRASFASVLLRTFSLTLSLSLALSGCGEGASRDSAPLERETGEVPEAGGTAILAEGADISQPLPVVIESSVDGNLQDIMYMTLLRGAWRDGELHHLAADESPMALARGYEYTGADSASLRYHLRSDVRWSDGQPVTAHDVVFTYQLLGDTTLASPRQDYRKNIRNVVAENDSTVTFHFTRRYPEMIFHSGHGIVPRHIYQGTAGADIRTHPSLTDPANGKLVVNGAFQISRWEKGRQVVLVPNPHFHPRPYLEQIVIRIIPEPATRLVELQTGAIDMLSGLPIDQIPALQAQDLDIRLEREAKRFYEYIAYNPEAHPAFRDPEIRRALGQALDVPAILQGLQLSEYATPAGGPYAPIFRRYYDAREQAPVSYDLERAIATLEAKGWRDTDGDGVREKEGRPLRFTLVTNAGNQRRADVSQVVQQQWKRAGVDARIRQLEFNTLSRNLMEREYEAALQGWGVGLSPDLTNLWSADAPFNYTGYRSPELSRLFELATRQPTEEQAVPYWKQAAALLAREQPYTWLYYMDQVDAVNNRLRNTKIDTYGRYQNVWEWWIPKSEQRRGTAARPSGSAFADSAAR